LPLQSMPTDRRFGCGATNEPTTPAFRRLFICDGRGRVETCRHASKEAPPSPQSRKPLHKCLLRPTSAVRRMTAQKIWNRIESASFPSDEVNSPPPMTVSHRGPARASIDSPAHKRYRHTDKRHTSRGGSRYPSRSRDEKSPEKNSVPRAGSESNEIPCCFNWPLICPSAAISYEVRRRWGV